MYNAHEKGSEKVKVQNGKSCDSQITETLFATLNVKAVLQYKKTAYCYKTTLKLYLATTLATHFYEISVILTQVCREKHCVQNKRHRYLRRDNDLLCVTHHLCSLLSSHQRAIGWRAQTK